MAKVMVSISDDLLAEIDNEAKRRETSRSAFLAAAAVRELSRRDANLVDQAVQRSLKRFEQMGAIESEDLIRSDRDSRR